MKPSLPTRPNSTNWLLHIAGLSILSVTAGGYYAFVYNPLVEANEHRSQRITQLERLLSASTEVEQQHEALRQELRTLKHSVETTHRRLPSDLQEGEFISEVQEIANSVGLEIEDYHLGEWEELANYSKAEVSLQCRGSYASICKFLDAIDHLARITEISTLELASHHNFESYPVYVTFVLYYGATAHDR